MEIFEGTFYDTFNRDKRSMANVIFLFFLFEIELFESFRPIECVRYVNYHAFGLYIYNFVIVNYLEVNMQCFHVGIYMKKYVFFCNEISFL